MFAEKMQRNWSETLSRIQKPQVLALAQEAATRPELVQQLFDIAKTQHPRIAMRAAWVLMHASRKNPACMQPYIRAIANGLPEMTNAGARRGFLSILVQQGIDFSEYGHLIDYFIAILHQPSKATAPKYAAMHLLVDAVRQFPELAQEVLAVLHQQLPYFETESLKRQARKHIFTINSLGHSSSL